jgi:nitroimidazol reductase NimA-like FMN-containing flavoprotein (pyridoxamine 5'-phosphate oxidase superfamily)
MHREMRRKDRQSTPEEAFELLSRGEYGILATSDGTNQPYALPLSYVYANDCIYFHCAREGHKLDNIKSNEKVSFTVVGATKVLPAKFSTSFESVVVFGTASIIEDENEKVAALKSLIEKYSGDFITEGLEYIDRAAAATCVVRIHIDRITGKNRQE